MPIERVDHIEVWATDLDRSVAFYTGVLGFRETRRTVAQRPDGTEFHQSCIVLGDLMVELIQAPKGPDNVAMPYRGVKAFALRVTGMDETIAALKTAGVSMVHEPRQGSSFDGLRAEIEDPDGTGIELREWFNGDTAANPDWRPVKAGVTRVS